MVTSHTAYHGVQVVTAVSHYSRPHSWVDVEIETASGRVGLTLFCQSRDMADALANAINYANASSAVQAAHDKRLSDAGIQEYRDLMANIPEGV